MPANVSGQPKQFIEAWLRIQPVLRQFEAAWQRGERPEIDAYLKLADAADASRLLRELVQVDLEYRIQAGEYLQFETYLHRYPALAGEAEAVLPLLAADIERERQASIDDRVGAVSTTNVQSPTAGASSERPDPARAGNSAGGAHRYRPVRFHARGGLGEVHLAEDTELHREVALKRIRATRAQDAGSRRRFLREAEITARLEHPGVVPVHGLVEDAAGEPCYAMRFIQGESLAEAISRFHSGVFGFDSLEFRQLLNRFVTVCNTIAYAHSRGIIHRDIKPHNVMLGKYGETLVVDWGLAKSIDRPAVAPVSAETIDFQVASCSEGTEHETRLGTAIGTPAFMCPEQAAGRWDLVGPASDVFSLGATLYMILTGQPPFSGSDVDRVLLAAQQGGCPPPRKLKSNVPAALEAICLKAIARNPAERYASALDLAKDFERWLADEAVSVGREPWSVRAARWRRRHRTLVTAAAAVLLVATISSILASVLLSAKNTQLEAAYTAEQIARTKAQANFELAKDAVNKYLTIVTDNPKLNEKDFFQLRKELLVTAVPSYQKLLEQQSDDPELEAVRAKAYHRLARVREAMGEPEAARTDYQEMQAIFAKLAANFPSVPRYRHDLAVSHHNLGNLLSGLGQREESAAAFRAALTLYEQLAADFPSEPAYRQGLAMSHNHLGVLLTGLGKNGEAEAAYRAALKIQEQLAGDFPSVPEYRQGLAASRHNLGRLLAGLGKNGEAEAAYRAALKIQEQLTSDSPGVSKYRQSLAMSHHNLANLLAGLGQRGEAEVAYRAALKIQEQLAADFPSVPAYRHELARSHYNLGNLLKELGKREPAESDYRAALKIQEQLAADFPSVPADRQELAMSHHNLGVLLKELGQHGEAEAAYRAALKVQDQLAADFPNMPTYRQELASSHNNLGVLLKELGKREQAEATSRAALKIQEQLAADFPRVPAYRQHLATSHNNLGRLLAELGQREEAEAAYRTALMCYEQLAADMPSVPAYAMELGTTYSNFGFLLSQKGKPQAALDWFAKAIGTLEPVLHKEPHLVNARLELFRSHAGRAEALDMLQRHGEAVQDWDRAIFWDDGKYKAKLQQARTRSLLRGVNQNHTWPLLWGWPRF